MKRSELILEFIDGTLDGNAEQQLFEELARQPEYRSEMRQFIAIGEAVRADREAFLPPRDLEKALMAGLGLAPLPGSAISGAAPAAAAPAASMATGLLAKLGLLKGLLPFAAAFLLGGLLVGGGVYFGMRDDAASMVAGTTATGTGLSARSDSAVEEEQDPATLQLPAVEQPEGSASSPALSSSTSAGGAPPAAATPSRRSSIPNSQPRRGSAIGLDNQVIDRRTEPANAALDPQPSTPVDTLVTANEQESPAQIDRSTLREGIGTIADSTPRGPNNAPTPVPPIVLPREEEAPRPATVIAEVRGIGLGLMLHNDNQAKVPAGRGLDELLAGGISLRVDDSYQFGVEVGRERYYQTFHNSTETPDGRRVVRIDQAPTLWWGGVSGRFNTAPLFDGATSFLQLTLGGAPSYGPMARARVGVRYDFGSPFGLTPIALTGSAEGSALLYFHKSESMASTNAGGSLGVEVGLW